MKKFVIGGGIVLFLVGMGFWGYYSSARPAALDEFAKCLNDKGAKFYGAFWCPHCQNQKAMFGRSEKYLPYIECSTPDTKGQLQVCTDKKITGYPTWEFADGSRESGEVEPALLAEKTGCTLPKASQ